LKALCGLCALALLIQPAIVGADNITLTLGSSQVRFSDADPATTAVISSTDNPISMAVKFGGQGNWVLTVLANGDLSAGANRIPISSVSWNASGAGFVSGTLSKSQSEVVASGTTDRSGTLSFRLNNSYSYPTGSYSQSLTFTAVSF
jgi:hypothetical protein